MASTAPPAEATNGDLIRWAFEVLDSRDVTPLRRYWTATTVQRFPQQTCVGPDAIAAYFAEAFAAMPDFHMQVVRLIEEGDDVFVHWHLTGTHSGAPFQGIAPTGRAIALDGMDHFVMRDGVVVSNFVVYDQMQFARQIGLLPRDGSAADRALKGVFGLKSRLSRRRP
jgi:predicted ester cyclase